MALTTVPASLSATALTLTTAAQPNITSVGTLTGLTVSGNIAGTLTTAAQTNITSVGTLTSLTVSGALNGTLSTAAQTNITSVGTLTGLTTTGNLVGTTATFSDTVTIDAADGDADEAYVFAVRSQEATAGRNYGMWIRAGSNSSDESFSVRNFDNSSMYFKVRGDGNVGIGTSSPSAKLHIEYSNNAATGGMTFRNTSTGSSAYTGFYFGNDTSATDAFVGQLGSNTAAYGGARSFLLGTNSSGGVGFMTAGTLKMLLSGSGNLGIGTGTASPAAPLHIQFTNNDGGVGGQLIKNTNTGTTSNFASLSTQAVNGTIQGTFGSAHYSNWGNAIVFAGSQSAHPFKILTSNTVRATFDTSGNVGIGTSTPATDIAKFGGSAVGLSVAGGQPVVAVRATGNAQHVGYLGQAGDDTYLGALGGGDLYIQTGTGGSTKVTVSAAGLVGIGAAPNHSTLEVTGDKTTANNLQLTLRGATNTNKQLIMGFDTTADKSYITSQIAGSAQKPLVINAANVGINTAGPSATLEVKGAGGGTGLTFKTTDASGNEAFYTQDGGRAGLNYWPLTVGIPSSTAAATNAKFQVEEAGLLTVLTNGNVGMGTATPAVRLNVDAPAADRETIRLSTYYSPINSLARGGISWHDGSNITGQIDTRYDGTTVDMHLGSLYSSGYNSSSRMIIKGNGTVRMPSQPYAQGRGSQAWTAMTGNGWDTQPIGAAATMSSNRGGSYSTANKRFTAPVDGVYLIIASWYIYQTAAASPGSQYIHPGIFVNGVGGWNSGYQAYNIFGHEMDRTGTSGKHYDGVQISFTAYLSETDYVEIKVYSPNTTPQSYEYYHYFSYTLLN